MSRKFNEKGSACLLATHRSLLSSDSNHIESKGWRTEHFGRAHRFRSKFFLNKISNVCSPSLCYFSLFLPQLDSATSLIQAAKNLMNAVVYTVKYSYVASTKYTRQGTVSVIWQYWIHAACTNIIFFAQLYETLSIPKQSPIVVWKMKAPEKKPLVRPEKPEEVRARVRRASEKKTQNPVHALAEFTSSNDAV